MVTVTCSLLSSPCLLDFSVAFLNSDGFREGPSPGSFSTPSTAASSFSSSHSDTHFHFCPPQGQLTEILVPPEFDQVVQF